MSLSERDQAPSVTSWRKIGLGGSREGFGGLAKAGAKRKKRRRTRRTGLPGCEGQGE